MMFMDEFYQKSVAENNRNLQFWENHLNGLKSLNFETYAEKLKVPILVPIGNKILFRGELQHTNEVTVSLGADYFVKCSTTQAEVLKQRRIKDAQSKVDLYTKEKEYLENRISFTKDNVLDKEGQEIIEEYTAEEDKAWREKHKENVKKYHQSRVKAKTEPEKEMSDTELWERLEELELQEELENELLDNYNEIVDRRKDNKFLEKEEALLRSSFKEKQNEENLKDSKVNKHMQNFDNNMNIKEKNKEADTETRKEISEHTLLQQVLDKQKELQHRLDKLKLKERMQSKTEQELVDRLDEMEQLDELEDEMERLDDILETEDMDTDNSIEDENKSETTKLEKCISFADEDDAETLEITFSHSDIEPNIDPFDAKKGITKPSDLYEAYSQLFDSKITSILKKSKYELQDKPVQQEKEQSKPPVKQKKQVTFGTDFEDNLNPEVSAAENAIIIKDVVENVGVNQHNIEGGARPTSLFKKRRMQKK